MTAPLPVPASAGPILRPARRAALLLALTAGLALLCCGGGLSAVLLQDLGGRSDGGVSGPFACGQGGLIDLKGRLPRVGQLGDEQMGNAATIILVGATLKVPPRGWVIAVATALQESRLSNLPHLGASNDHDSIGLFQQRPSQGWGTPSQLQDPAYAARKFFQKLLTVRGWESMALTDAAQAVQRSAFPDAYAKHEPLAAQIVNLLADGAARAVGAGTRMRCAAAGEIAASGWTVPAGGSIVSGFREPGRPSHDGVDIAASRGTPIRAAAAGTVIIARCNASSHGRPYSCDRDGSPTTVLGCGWYVDILHAGNIITRYCHMVTRPRVVVGQLVAAGEIIGQVGSSGHSSGPHLHFEVHQNGDRYSSGAIDPRPWMRDRGVPLGAEARQ